MNMIGFFIPKRELPQDRVIPEGSHISGDFQILQPVRVDGMLEGILHASQSVTISVNGCFHGKVKCRNLLVSGVFSGEAECEEIQIFPGGRLVGRIQSQTLVLQRGGIFEGQRMIPFQGTAPIEKKPSPFSNWIHSHFLSPLFHPGKSA